MFDMRVGFIGAGKVGSAFGHYLKDQGIEVVGYSSRSKKSATEAAQFTGTEALDINEVVSLCDYVFITTPDDEIIHVWNQIKKSDLQDKKIFHMSGSLSSSVFDGIEDCRALGYSLHPLFPFTDKFSYKQLDKVVFTVEGKNIASIDAFLRMCKINWFCIDDANKGKYHAAAVFASNYLTALAKISKTLFVECGLPELAADRAIQSLIGGSVANILEKGVEASLTGPYVRGDTETIKRHLHSIDDASYNHVYRELGKIATFIAVENGNINKEQSCEILNILGGDIHEKNSNNI